MSALASSNVTSRDHDVGKILRIIFELLLQTTRLESKQDIEPCGHSKRELDPSDVTNVLTYTRFGDYFLKNATTMTDLLMNTMHKVATIATMAMFLAATNDLFKALFRKNSVLFLTGRDAVLFKIPEDKLRLPQNPLNNDEQQENLTTHYASDSFLSLDTENAIDGLPKFDVASFPNFFLFARKVRANDFTLAQWPLLMNELAKQYQSTGDFPGSEPTSSGTLEVKDNFVLSQVQQELQDVEFPNSHYKTITTQIMKGVDTADIKERM